MWHANIVIFSWIANRFLFYCIESENCVHFEVNYSLHCDYGECISKTSFSCIQKNMKLYFRICYLSSSWIIQCENNQLSTWGKWGVRSKALILFGTLLNFTLNVHLAPSTTGWFPPSTPGPCPILFLHTERNTLIFFHLTHVHVYINK